MILRGIHVKSDSTVDLGKSICALLDSTFPFGLVVLLLAISSGDFILFKAGKMNMLQRVIAICLTSKRPEFNI